jgi:type IV pilus assembly protein PilA
MKRIILRRSIMRRDAFTLIELMIVILIVAILAAVAIPLLYSRIEAAKWSEGKAMMGTIATAIRAYQGEKGEGAPQPAIIGNVAPTLGFNASDLTGTYFVSTDFSISTYNNPVGGPFTFTVSCTPAGANRPSDAGTRTLNSAGVWTP